jgi:hypothetical protein
LHTGPALERGERLDQIRIAPGLDRLPDGLRVGQSRDDNDPNPRVRGFQFLDELDPASAEAVHVYQSQIGLGL